MKVFIVEVTRAYRMAVVADNAADAELVAVESLDEAEDTDDCESVQAVVVECEVSAPVPGDFANTIPYGVERDDPKRDWTIEQWIGVSS